MSRSEHSAQPMSFAAFVVAIVIVLLVRQMLTLDLPIFVRESYFDDQLMIRMAEGLVAGDWLGAYDGGTLMKGCFFSLFLAANDSLGLSYLASLTAIHSLACLFFVTQMRFLLRDRRLLLVLLVVLAFDPGSFACDSFQKVYRNSITIPQVLVLYGALFGLWLDYGTKKGADLARACIAGVTLWAFWNTREDAMWVVPFVVVALVLVLAKAIMRFRGDRLVHGLVLGLVVVVLPVALLGAGNALIKNFNEQRYGAPVRLECADGAFADAMRSIYSVRSEVDLEYVSVPTEKLARLYAASPTLRSIEPELEEQLAFYSTIGRHGGRGETEDGWFLWALRRAGFLSGKAATLVDAEAFYRQICDEIEAGLDTGVLERGDTMPSALMSPWRAGYARQMLDAIPRAIVSIVDFDGALAVAGESRAVNATSLARYESLTNDWAVPMDDTSSEHAAKAAASSSRVNAVAAVYQKVNPLLAIVALLMYIGIIVVSVRRKTTRHLPFILVVLGMALSILVMAIGVSYTELTAFPAIRSTYVAGAYPLALSCVWVTLLYGFEEIVLWKRTRQS